MYSPLLPTKPDKKRMYVSPATVLKVTLDFSDPKQLGLSSFPATHARLSQGPDQIEIFQKLLTS